MDQTAPPSEVTPVESKTYPGPFSVMANVFIAPTKAFEDIPERPVIWSPLIAVSLFAVLFWVITFDQMLPVILAAQGAEGVNPDDLGAAKNIILLSMVAIMPIAIALFSVIETLLAWAFGAVLGGKSKFGAIFSVVMLSGLIATVGRLLITAPMIAMKDTIYISLGPAAFLSDQSYNSVAYAVLNQFDIFGIWGLIVLGFGFSRVFNLSTAKGMAIAFVIGGLIIFAAGYNSYQPAP